eukprot:4762723-Amphidinium_carterae.3
MLQSSQNSYTFFTWNAVIHAHALLVLAGRLTLSIRCPRKPGTSQASEEIAPQRGQARAP